jgi:hypothetical protein
MINKNIKQLIDEYHALLTDKAKMEISEDKLIKFMDYLCPYWFDTERNFQEKMSKNDPDRYDFEREIWDLGEKIRQCLAARNQKRGQSVLLDTAVKILHAKEYRHGRVSFVFLFEDYADTTYSSDIKDLLFDSDVQLQLSVLHAIRKMKAFDLIDDVKKFQEITPLNWMKKECDKYLNKANKQQT